MLCYLAPTKLQQFFDLYNTPSSIKLCKTPPPQYIVSPQDPTGLAGFGFREGSRYLEWRLLECSGDYSS